MRNAEDLRDIELVLVVAPQNRGWILETICEELHDRMSMETALHYMDSPLPRAPAFFFSHWSLFEQARRRGQLRGAKAFVFYTHPPVTRRLDSLKHAHLVAHADAIVSMSSTHASWLGRRGVPRRKVHVAIPGTAPDLFAPKGGEDRQLIGFCSAFYGRKAPDRIREIIAAIPEHDFLLVGRNWQKYESFDQLTSLENLVYREAAYEQWPQLFRQMRVFVSPSKLEGGPIPLLEAMAAGACPVASRTGFAPDLIRHGENGYIVDPEAPLREWTDAIDAAWHLDADVAGTVDHLTWDSFARSVEEVVTSARRAHMSARRPFRS